MGERDPRAAPPEFGEPFADRRQRILPEPIIPSDDAELSAAEPLQEVAAAAVIPEGGNWYQYPLPDVPAIDNESALPQRGEQPHGRQGSIRPTEASGTVWTLPGTATTSVENEENRETPRNPRAGAEEMRALRISDVLAEYNLSPEQLRNLVALGTGLNEILKSGSAPEEVVHLFTLLSTILTPHHREQIRSPAEVAGLLMVEMGHLDQEQLRVICLDTKNRVQKVHLVYQGSLNSASIRIAEVYKEPVRLNSAAIIVAHNHPSGQPDPSPEDILVTRQIVEAGKVLDVECIDHLVIGHGKWVSLRERGLGFDS